MYSVSPSLPSAKANSPSYLSASSASSPKVKIEVREHDAGVVEELDLVELHVVVLAGYLRTIELVVGVLRVILEGEVLDLAGRPGHARARVELRPGGAIVRTEERPGLRGALVPSPVVRDAEAQDVDLRRSIKPVDHIGRSFAGLAARVVALARVDVGKPAVFRRTPEPIKGVRGRKCVRRRRRRHDASGGRRRVDQHRLIRRRDGCRSRLRRGERAHEKSRHDREHAASKTRF